MVHVFIVYMIAPTNAIQKPHVKPAQNYFYRRFFSFFFAVASHLLINARIKMSHGLRRREKCTRLLHALEWPNHALNRNWVSSVLFRHNSLATPRLKFTLESYSLQPVTSDGNQKPKTAFDSRTVISFALLCLVCAARIKIIPRNKIFANSW